MFCYLVCNVPFIICCQLFLEVSMLESVQQLPLLMYCACGDNIPSCLAAHTAVEHEHHSVIHHTLNLGTSDIIGKVKGQLKQGNYLYNTGKYQNDYHYLASDNNKHP